MAKLVGIIGTGSGRLGNAVLSKGDNGATFARTYQSQVRNPRTVAQRKQRAKMNLAGQISKFTPASALVGLHQGGDRKNRSAFVASLLNACTVATDSNGDYQAALVPDKINFSEGPVPLVTGKWEQYSMDLIGVDHVTFQSIGRAYSVAIGYLTAAVMGISKEEFISKVNPLGIYGEMMTVITFSDNGCDFVGCSAILFYDTISGSIVSDSMPSLQVHVNGNVQSGQKAHVYRTPFLLSGDEVALVSTDATIVGNNITATEKVSSSYMDILSTWRYVDRIPSETVLQLIRHGNVKWGNSHYLSTVTYTA